MSPRSVRGWWDVQRAANLMVIVLVLYVVIWSLHPSLVLSGSTITGGDTGSHVATAWYMRQHWGGGALTSWYPGWFDGMPLYSYYFVLPDALAAAGSYLIGYAVAFKLATVLGSLLLPVAAFTMGKLFRAKDPIPAALAGATLPFLFDSSFTIDGGNLFSTLAGEYSFSLSLALSLIAIGLFARGMREGRGRWLSALFLSLTLAAHLLPWMFALVVIGVLLLMEVLDRGWLDADRRIISRRHGRRAVSFVVSAGLLSLGLSAWWLLPFATTQNYTSSMGYTNDSTDSFHAIFTQLSWLNDSGHLSGDAWVIVLAAMALVMAFFWRDRLGITLTLSAVLAAVAYIADPQGVLFNERLVPFWFISIYLSAGWLVGTIACRVANRIRPPVPHSQPDSVDFEADDFGWSIPYDPELQRRRRVVRATYLVAALTLVSTVPGLVPGIARVVHITPGSNQVTNWAGFNYSGYEAQPAWPEYHGIITTMQRVAAQHGCGRAMWEYNADEGRFGTTMALMLLPYWTNNCVGSQEGLFFESSPTMPFHFLIQAELSDEPDRPVTGLDWRPLNVAQGVRHLQMLGVRYYMTFSADIVAAAAKNKDLREVAVTRRWPSARRWHIYEVLHSDLVAPLTHLPNVVTGINSRTAWLAANQTWFNNSEKWPILYAASGPANWPRTASWAKVTSRRTPTTSVSHVRIHDQSLSFHVSRLGVPVVVKISYYPRWHVTGATGPYRVSPNLMVVVPTRHDVTLVYASTPAVTVGNLVTDVTVFALVVVAWRRRWWRRPRSVNSGT